MLNSIAANNLHCKIAANNLHCKIGATALVLHCKLQSKCSAEQFIIWTGQGKLHGWLKQEPSSEQIDLSQILPLKKNKKPHNFG